MAKTKKRICCIEAYWEDEGQVAEPTIKPMLEMLCQWGYWPHIHTKCGTVAEAKKFLEDEWNESPKGSVLFFATHGSPGWITFSNSREEWICLRDLAHCLSGQCKGRYVHISACNVFEDKTVVQNFLRKTGAAAVSGYRTDVGWAETEKPAVLSDLMLLNALWEAVLDFSPGKRKWRNDLKTIEGDVQRRFGDCQFEIVQR